MFRGLLAAWHRCQRKIDVETLWPACRDQARDLDRARTAFALHAFSDRAWLALGSKDAIMRKIDRLR